MNAFRFAAIAAIGLFAACDGGTVCDEAADALEDCVPDGGTTVTGTVTEEQCEEGSAAECGSQCVVDAIDDGGCDAVLDASANGDYLKCALGCLEDKKGS